MGKIKYLFLFAAAGLFSAGWAFADLGISPQDWIEKNGMPGQTIEKTFVLARSDAAEDIFFASKISGELAGWIEMKSGTTFTIPKGKQQFPIAVSIKIPDNAEKREYKGEIRMRPQSKASGAQVSVIIETLIRINLTVTDNQFSSYQVQQIKIPEQEEGDFVNVSLNIINRGNVAAKPTKVTAEFFDQYYSKKLASQEITDFSREKGVDPFSTQDFIVKVPANLSSGQYWADVKVFQDEKEAKKDHLTFKIVPAGTLIKNAAIFGFNIWAVGGAGIAILLVFIIIIIMVLKRKRRMPPTQPQQFQPQPSPQPPQQAPEIPLVPLPPTPPTNHTEITQNHIQPPPT